MTPEDKNELVNYRINRAKETLQEAYFQIENKKWTTAVNRLYYACYYSVIALLAKHDINAKTHSGVRQMLAMHFIKPGIIEKRYADFYVDLFEMRQTGDYDDFIVFDEEKVSSLWLPAKELILHIETLITVK